MGRRLDPRTWPITVKVPLAVALLMMLVGIALSERVLDRLAGTQERHLRDLAQSYLDGLSSSAAPSILRDDVWEVFDAIERTEALNKSLRPRGTIVTDGEGIVIAASDPRRYPVGTRVTAAQGADVEGESFSFEAGADVASAVRRLAYPGRTVGIIRATFDTTHLAAERREVLLALVMTNGLVTLALATAGWLVVARMMRPVRILTEHLGAARESAMVPIQDEVAARTRGEFGQLFRSYNGLVQSLREREELADRLAEEERLGSLGRLASALAHEINNPLGGLFNALSTLKVHGHLAHVRRDSIGLVDRGLVGIRDLVRTTLALYRTDLTKRDLTAADIDDLKLLVRPEARRKAVNVTIVNGLAKPTALPSTPIRQAVLNLLLNAVAAAPEGSTVELTVAVDGAALRLSVRDAGPGLPDPATDVLVGRSSLTPLGEGGGLGLWTTRRLVAELGGAVDVTRPSTGGTVVSLVIPMPTAEDLSHVA